MWTALASRAPVAPVVADANADADADLCPIHPRHLVPRAWSLASDIASRVAGARVAADEESMPTVVDVSGRVLVSFTVDGISVQGDEPATWWDVFAAPFADSISESIARDHDDGERRRRPSPMDRRRAGHRGRRRASPHGRRAPAPDRRDGVGAAPAGPRGRRRRQQRRHRRGQEPRGRAGAADHHDVGRHGRGPPRPAADVGRPVGQRPPARQRHPHERQRHNVVPAPGQRVRPRAEHVRGVRTAWEPEARLQRVLPVGRRHVAAVVVERVRSRREPRPRVRRPGSFQASTRPQPRCPCR